MEENLKNEDAKKQQAEKHPLLSKIEEITPDKEKQTKDARYTADDIMLEKYITKDDTPDKFKNMEYMYHICTILNSCCSTRMGAHRVYATALAFSKHGDTIKEILKKKSPLDNDDLEKIQDTLCQKISLEDQDSKDFRSYSFATKFLAFHSEYKYYKKDDSLFPIYDGQVCTVIKKYSLNKINTLEEFITKSKENLELKKQKILEQEKADLDKYRTKHKLKNTIHLDDYLQFYRLMRILSIATGINNLKRLDRIFWTLGDEIQEEQKQKKASNNL